MKKIIAYIPFMVLFYSGHSISMVMGEKLRLYWLYKWLMDASLRIDRWADLGQWVDY